jgi:FkbM family methyltransferase
MTALSLLPTDRTIHDFELFEQLRGRQLSARVQVLCVIGAHRFDELPLVNRILPGLKHIYVFEPLQGPLESLHALARQDPRIRVFPVAVSDRDGTAHFHVTNNQGESSSLLALGSHREIFPEVQVQQTIEVPTRRLDSVLAEHGLALPDVLIIDVQGAEYQVLRSLPQSLLDHVRLIYTEVSTEAVYQGAGLLSDVEAVLTPRFVNLGYVPLRPGVPMHGNAIFAARDDVPQALQLTARARWRLAFRRFKRRVRRQRQQPSGAAV